MTVTPSLPEWTDERRKYLFAGIELAAYKDAGGKWMVKTGRCNLCGLCCGDCEHLKTQGTEKICDLGSSRPMDCSVSLGRSRVSDADCTETFEEIP